MGSYPRDYDLMAQSCPTHCDPKDCSLPVTGSSVHGILQARILEWVAIPFSRGASHSRDWSWVSCIAGRFFTFKVNKLICIFCDLLMFPHCFDIHLAWCVASVGIPLYTSIHLICAWLIDNPNKIQIFLSLKQCCYEYSCTGSPGTYLETSL